MQALKSENKKDSDAAREKLTLCLEIKVLSDTAKKKIQSALDAATKNPFENDGF